MSAPWTAAPEVLAHLGGMPVEELLGASPGALVLATGVSAWWRARRARRTVR
jgi:glucose uptake protein GlcU